MGRIATVDVMASNVGTHRGGESLTHQALLYVSKQDFLAGVVPFIRDGLECGDPIRITVTDRNADWLRVAMGADAGRVMFDDLRQCYRHPVRTLAAVHRTVQQASRAGLRLRLRLIGEPWWTAHRAAEYGVGSL